MRGATAHDWPVGILAGGALSACRLPPVLRECGIAQKYSAWAQVGARSQHYILWLEAITLPDRR